ncbi:unnamed protein product [Paramecium sonneborni]|uniref:Uncharacterized protein n=1 Tax=Paramecium sonneborni TaxID=65129 RepID=A0A8S1RT84_9CILI|nr:unnamed protein product [Paramecium sonneborni]
MNNLIQKYSNFLVKIKRYQDYDEEFKQSLLDDEDAYLRENKHFSVKALSYVDESQSVPSLRNFKFQEAFPCYAIIQAASIFFIHSWWINQIHLYQNTRL